MGRRGPIPQTASDLRIVGSHRAKRRAETPALEVECLEPTEWLSDAAKAEFRSLAGLLYEAGVTTANDRAALEVVAVILTRFREVSALATPDAEPAILSLHNQLARLAFGWLREFGMTPASRARVPRAAKTEESTESKLETFLKGSTN